MRRSATTASSATAAPLRWWRATVQSIGCACRISTHRASLPPRSTRSRAAASASLRTSHSRWSTATRPDTNVLERTFVTADGAVRVTDAVLLPMGGLAPARELARRVDGLSGRVRMHWTVEPRFDYGRRRGMIGVRAGVPVATQGPLAVALRSWDAGKPRCEPGPISGRFELAGGESASYTRLPCSDSSMACSPARRSSTSCCR